MHKHQVYAMLSKSFEENQGSYMDPTALNNLSEIDAGDAEFMGSLTTEFLGFEASILEFLAEPAKSDVNFFDKLLEAGTNAKPNWGFLRYSSDSIKANPSLFLKWIRESGGLECLQFADQAVLKNAEITTVVTELVYKNLDMIKLATDALRDDKQLMKKAVAWDAKNLEFASERLKQDAELVLDAIERDAKACHFAHSRLFESESFVKKLIERVKIISARTFESIPESIKRDRQCLIEIAKKLESGSNLEKFINPTDRDFFSEIIGVNGSMIYFATEAIKDDDDLARKAIKGGASLLSVSERLRNDADFVSWAIDRWPALFRKAGENARDNQTVVLAAVSKQGSALDWASERLQDVLEVVSAAVEEDPWALQYASARILNDKEFILKVCAIEPHVYHYAGDSLFSDREFAMLIVPTVANSLLRFSAEIQNDPEISSINIDHFD
ncbi:MAG: DUF4116 domain-containing protein [Burkholderiales bacterium]|nr:DUF4116 domain-containing protein [Burkholderiales bacterium]